MKNWSFAILILAVVGMGGSYSSQTKEEKLEVLRWEYKVISVAGNPKEMNVKFNDLGKEGWEVVTADGPNFVFKKELP